MPLDLHFTCPLPNGVHARPASALEEVAACFGAEITLTNDRNRRAANVKSVLAIVGADIRKDDTCRVRVSGPDEQDAFAAISAFLARQFPVCDDDAPAQVTPNGELPLPPPLRHSGGIIRRGTPLVPGIGQGRIVRASRIQASPDVAGNGPVETAEEIRKLDHGLSGLATKYEDHLARVRTNIELRLLRAHRSVARDPELRSRLHDAARQPGCTAARAIAETETHFTAMLTAAGTPLLRERVADLQDVCAQLLTQIYGEAAAQPDIRLAHNSILIAESLTPAQFLRLDRRRLKGLVFLDGTTTSHTVILARSFAIPTLTAVQDIDLSSLNGNEAILDADTGLLLTSLTPAATRYYKKEHARIEERRSRQREFARKSARTEDGHRLEIAANISSSHEADAAFEAGAESIGLFRTEMLFLDRDSPPSEEEQFQHFRNVLLAAGNRPVIVRAMDLGADKSPAYLPLPRDDNPFLGYRAVRLYPEFQDLVRAQLRAVLRASPFGRVKLMLPMIAGLQEARAVKKMIREEQARCESNGLRFSRVLRLGAMIEVPSAAFLIDQLAHELDFFSIGTNDLLQCFAAADRNNPRVAGLCDPLDPGFLRLLKKIVDDARAAGKWIGLCGEMAADPACLPLLIGLGLDEISAAPPAISNLKTQMARWRTPPCRQLLRRALLCPSADQVRALIEDARARVSAPLIEPDLVIIHSDASTKDEAIKEAVDRLYVLSRTDRPRLVEHAIWQREQEHSTGFGHGFAIPHCKNCAVETNSLAVVKPRKPIPWESLDGEPVGIVILMAIRETDPGVTHMKILSTLARKIMHDDFRQRLLRNHDPAALCGFLKGSLGLP